MVTSLVLEKPREYMNVDYDGLWKKLIYELFEEFLLFFAAHLYEEVDFLKKPEFLQQELFREIIQEKKGKQVADQVVKVFLKNGGEKWIFIHIEIQGDPDPDFSKRMFRYYYRIFDKYDRDVIAIALLTDASNYFRPNMYQRSSFGTTLTYQYNIYKFQDQDEEQLLRSKNPFGLAVLAGKYANEAKRDTEKRYRFKREIIQSVLQHKNYPPEERRLYVSALIYFIDYLLQIPEELTKKLRREIIISEEAKEMLYLDRNNLPLSWSEWEKTVKEEGREEGIEKKQREIAKKMLQEGYSIQEIVKVTELSEAEVRKL
ncbi:Rpn family recombination-promoting nuclease/putative transposase [Siminovitchia sp. 179-K 8D1 HS]|uniref:Rpn family recombination-promoting nuclease/putative transposase n=1 Tax=Siminovitchia sp. 179-K 8D1 HS TaxID=3142385 RepID=UPI0039A1C77E